KLQEYEDASQHYRGSEIQGGIPAILGKDALLSEIQGDAAQEDDQGAPVKPGGQLYVGSPVGAALAHHIGTGESGKHHDHADDGKPEHHLFGAIHTVLGVLLCYIHILRYLSKT